MLLEKLGSFETTTFDALAGRGAKRIPLDHLSSEAQKRLEQLELDDVPGIWELHLGGLPRIWGLRFGEVMSLVWWDPEHQVCPAHKKHT